MKHSAAVALLIFAAACDKAPAPAAKTPDAAATPPAAATTAAATTAAATTAAAPTPGGLLHPDSVKVAAAGPDSFIVHVLSSRGAFDLKVHRDWSPKGADRLYYLVANNFYDGIRFFRVVDGFMAQFGMPGDPAIGRVWSDRDIEDEPVKRSNKRGTLTFADKGPNTRSTQLFINFHDNAQLDGMGFTPFAEVTNGMNAVDSLYKGYGETPDQGRISTQGNAYLAHDFPKLDSIVTARVSQEWKKGN
jgi:peptidyl-prolyl cis-trans isomerase A (cyclophilin A)